MRQYCCCFTGHRPAKLPWKYNDESPAFSHFYLALAAAVQEMIRRGCKVFYSGMAEGVDLWAADIVLCLRDAEPEAGIRLIAVCPCKGQELAWGAGNRKAYREILQQADDIVVLYEHYNSACMHHRNAYMLEHCGHIIAGYDGVTMGGTRNTVEGAVKQGLDVLIVNPMAFSNQQA